MLKNSQIPTENVTESAAFPRTDLACESVGALNEPYRGAVSEEGEICSVPVSRLEVLNKEGEIETGRKRGSYVTLYCPLMKYLDAEDAENITEALSVLLREFTQKLCGAPVSSATKVLVAGLGNRFITADALGPRAADKVAVTSHVMESGLLDSIGCSSISAVHPGVMGQTGIEAGAMIKGAADYVKPDVVIAIDALAARSTKRLASTIQLSDTGIEPGSGIGNRRSTVNRESIGCPVIAIGVPTVVDCATLVWDALERAGCECGEEMRASLEKERSYFVSPKDGDIICDEVAALIASAINRAYMAEGL